MADQFLEQKAVGELLEAWKVGARPVVVWLGAGMSTPAGLPSWVDLRTAILNAFKQDASLLQERDKAARLAKLENLKKMDSLWATFEELEKLGKATFDSVIKSEFTKSLKVSPPEAYKDLWDLGVRGVISLNVDGFSRRAFAESQFSKLTLVERNGFNVSALIGYLTKNDSRIIANIHGDAEDPSSWVFTESKLQQLLKKKDFNEFVFDCIKYGTIVLLGVSATDKAVIDHFTSAMAKAPGAGPHFWVTCSPADEQTKAENSGIRVIRYINDGKHTFVSNLIEKLKAYKLVDENADPVTYAANTRGVYGDIPTPKQIMELSPNQIRKVLNGAAVDIIDGNNGYVEFDNFCKKYSRAIHDATYFDSDEVNEADQVADYKVCSSEQEGGFGRVWRAIDSDGNQVAIKVFKYEVREKLDLLKAFRRGIRSMRFLEQRNVPGIVKFIDATEIPPVVIMEWVEGITLHEAVMQGYTKDWEQIVRVGKDLATAIHAVHSTPERVVHRDLRPQNIMLRNYYQDRDSAQVVVLDFDLSWHLGALEKSVYVSGGTSYLAPEQLTEKQGASTRSAAVDSFGLGMTLYYMVSGKDPEFFMYARNDWESRVGQVCGSIKSKNLACLPKRISRLILAATHEEQSRRITFAQMAAELHILYSVFYSGDASDIDLLAEEVISNTPSVGVYKASDDGAYFYESYGGLGFKVFPESYDEKLIRLSFSYVQSGVEDFNMLPQVGAAFKSISDKFKGYDVSDRSCDLSHGDFRVSLLVRCEQKISFAKSLGGTCEQVIDGLLRVIARA
ncbi:MAG: protein kinase [Moraxellaceae bacterium]|nr:protein kinase [Moraxellaceae bacterium]